MQASKCAQMLKWTMQIMHAEMSGETHVNALKQVQPCVCLSQAHAASRNCKALLDADQILKLCHASVGPGQLLFAWDARRWCLTSEQLQTECRE